MLKKSALILSFASLASIAPVNAGDDFYLSIGGGTTMIDTVEGDTTISGTKYDLESDMEDVFAYDIEFGNLDTRQFNSHINIPVSDSLRTRIALVVKKRGGTTHNLHTGNDFNDINARGARFSLDWDIADNTTLKLTHERFEGDDNRTNIGTVYCDPHPLYGCNPLERGQPNATPDSRGSTEASPLHC